MKTRTAIIGVLAVIAVGAILLNIYGGSGAQFFGFLGGSPPAIHLKVSHHSLLTKPKNAGDLFRSGAELLAKDDDGSGSGPHDDTALLLKFDISENGVPFPNQHKDARYSQDQQFDYSEKIYNNILNYAPLVALSAATFSDVKQVEFLDGGSGWANRLNRTMILSQKAIASSTIHEYGHLCNLDDRSSDRKNVMHKTASKLRNEVNVCERDAYIKCKGGVVVVHCNK